MKQNHKEKKYKKEYIWEHRNGEKNWNNMTRSNKLVSLKEDLVLAGACVYLHATLRYRTEVDSGTLVEALGNPM